MFVVLGLKGALVSGYQMGQDHHTDLNQRGFISKVREVRCSIQQCTETSGDKERKYVITEAM